MAKVTYTPNHMEPLITVAVPFYNRPEMAFNAVQSVLSQNGHDFEVLAIDDASTDDGWEKLSDLSDPRLRLIKNPTNLGVMGNFNRCLYEAKGKYIRILCSDDWLLPKALERERELLKMFPGIALLNSPIRAVNSQGRPIRTIPEFFSEGKHTGPALIAPVLKYAMNTSNNPFNFPSGILFDRKLALQLNGFDVSLKGVADFDLWLKMLAHGDVAMCSHPTCVVEDHSKRWSYELFYEGSYIRGRIAVVKRRKTLFLRCDRQYNSLLNDLSGQCLYYALRCLAELNLEGVVNHLKLLKELRLSPLNILTSCFRFVIIKVSERAKNWWQFDHKAQVFPIMDLSPHSSGIKT